MGVYRPHHVKAMLSHDNGSIYGNKSYIQDLIFPWTATKPIVKEPGLMSCDTAQDPEARSLRMSRYGRSNPPGNGKPTARQVHQ